LTAAGTAGPRWPGPSPPFVGKVELARGARQTVKVTLVPIVAPAPAAPLPPSPTPAAPVVQEAPAEPAPTSWTTGRKLAVGLAAGGAAAIGAGLYFGMQARSAAERINAACAAGCEGDAIKSDDQSRLSNGRTQWILLGTGAAALAGGTILWLVSGPEKTNVEAALLPGGGAVSLRGTW
jgi:hypothetical protein